MVHKQFNDRVKAQGIDVDKIVARQNDIMFGFFRKYFRASGRWARPRRLST